MARNSSAFEKQRRERLKKQKADDKRSRRQKKKQDAQADNPESLTEERTFPEAPSLGD